MLWHIILLAKCWGVKSVPIEFGIEGKRRWLRIKDALELETEAIEGGDKSRDSVVVNVPFTVVPGKDMRVAPSSKYNYNDHGMEWILSINIMLANLNKFCIVCFICTFYGSIDG